MRSIEEYRKIAADLRDTNATSLVHQASSAIEELLEVIEGQTDSVGCCHTLIFLFND